VDTDALPAPQMMLENAGNPDEDKRIDSPEAFEQNVLRTFDNGKSTMHGHAANSKTVRRLLGRQKQGCEHLGVRRPLLSSVSGPSRTLTGEVRANESF
jgi:hypothetical protein